MGEVKIPDKIKCQNTLDVNWACSLIRDLIIFTLLLVIHQAQADLLNVHPSCGSVDLFVSVKINIVWSQL